MNYKSQLLWIVIWLNSSTTIPIVKMALLNNLLDIQLNEKHKGVWILFSLLIIRLLCLLIMINCYCLAAIFFVQQKRWPWLYLKYDNIIMVIGDFNHKECLTELKVSITSCTILCLLFSKAPFRHNVITLSFLTFHANYSNQENQHTLRKKKLPSTFFGASAWIDIPSRYYLVFPGTD